jgi:hypothetical protein
VVDEVLKLLLVMRIMTVRVVKRRIVIWTKIGVRASLKQVSSVEDRSGYSSIDVEYWYMVRSKQRRVNIHAECV